MSGVIEYIRRPTKSKARRAWDTLEKALLGPPQNEPRFFDGIILRYYRKNHMYEGVAVSLDGENSLRFDRLLLTPAGDLIQGFIDLTPIVVDRL